MTGSVVTFYSYKGGVGRSFLVANAGALLARWGYRVLCVDWDIEAPGLGEYFRPWLGALERPGLVELVAEVARDGKADWRAHTSEVRLPGAEAPLHLITAGAPGADLSNRVHAIDWRGLYDRSGFGAALEAMRDAWKAEYDLILVDSRTGISDIGGICTVHLPDVLVAVFTANQQSLGGVKEVVQLAEARRSKLPLARAGLITLPVLARLDARGQDDLAKQWLRRSADELAPLYERWLDEEVSPRQFLEVTRIPYFSVWTFGERLAVLEERDSDPEYVSYHVASIAALLARRFDDPAALCRNRDGYVELARAQRPAVMRGTDQPVFEYDYCIASDVEQGDLAEQIAIELQRGGATTLLDIDPIASGPLSRVVLDRRLGGPSYRHMIVLRDGPKLSVWLRVLLASFAEEVSADPARLVFDVQLSPSVPDLRGSRVMADVDGRQFRRIDARHVTAERIVEEISAVTRSERARSPGGGIEAIVEEMGMERGVWWRATFSIESGSIDDHLRQRAAAYVSVDIPSYIERVLNRDNLAMEMGQYVHSRRISHDDLARARHDGLTAALAVAARMAPEAGDLVRLITAGVHVSLLHTANVVLSSIAVLVDRERVAEAQRRALESLLDVYERLATNRHDEPLEALVALMRRRLQNFA